MNSRVFAGLAVALISCGHAYSQAYPNRPLRLVVPASPGSATDVRGRWLAPKLSAALGQSIVVDNRAGAAGSIATETVAKSAPDGYTLLMVHQGTLVFNPHIYSRLGYDPLSSFSPITRVGISPLVLAVHPTIPVASVAELVQLAKQKPGQLNYGSPGSGTPPHLAGELFKRMGKLDAVHVPYKGGGPALLDLIGGRLTYTFDSAAVQMPSVRAGKLKALAVTSSKRIAALPDIRTIAESGLPGYEFWSWQGMVAPAGTPKHIIGQLNAHLVKIMGTADAREWFAEQGAEPVTDSSEAFAAYIKADYDRWGPVIRDAGIKAD
ncbi:MAG: Bug family tripartite tricarboxylate transporter substrate binding protein [Burkholderiales bacterium]